MLRHIMANFPAPRGLLFDHQDVVRAIPPGELMDGRIAVMSGSFFDDVPAGADIYTLMSVLHDWPDEDCARILRACRAVMGQRMLLLIGERLLEPDPTRGRQTDYLTDIQMMAMFGGARARTNDEFRRLLAEADFELQRIIPTGSPISLVEAAAA